MNVIADGSGHGVPWGCKTEGSERHRPRPPDMRGAIVAEKGSFRMDLKQSGYTHLRLLAGFGLHAPSRFHQPDSSSGS